MGALEARMAEWRRYMARSRALDGSDVEELETHLLAQIADLGAAGLSEEEAFLVAIKRMGDVDAVAREFALEHSDRLWKQLVMAGPEEPESQAGSLKEALVFASMAAVAIHAPRLFIYFGRPLGESQFFRNAALITLPFLAWYFGRRHQLGLRQGLVTAGLFVVAGLAINLYPWAEASSTELLAALHLPVALWFAVAYAYAGGDWRSHERRMDLVRFTGEWFIYYVLIALGGGVLLALTALILEPMNIGAEEQVIEWILMSGAAGAVIVAAWLVEAKQSVVENMAPVLAKVFTPLFAVMLAGSAVIYAISGLGQDFNRDLLAVFDALMVVIVGLVLYGMSARDSSEAAGIFDRIQFVAVVSALALDLMVLGSMITRVSELGFTPNRVAALGLNLVLLVNLGWAAWLTLKVLRGRATLHPLETWQMAYLPVFGAWAGAVVLVLPPLFAFG